MISLTGQFEAVHHENKLSALHSINHNVFFSLLSLLQILVWHTRTEKPVLVNEGKKGFTDSNVEI